MLENQTTDPTAASNDAGAQPECSKYAELFIAVSLLAGCASAPSMPYTLDAPATVLVPAQVAGLQDKRGRFREIFCTVLETHKNDLPDYRPCNDALTRVGIEPAPSNTPVVLAPSRRRLIAVIVPGFGYDCFANWLGPPGAVASHLRQSGYDLSLINIEGLSSTKRNALLIRDALMALSVTPGAPRIVLVGYSKGANDVLEAIVTYPELHTRLAAVLSIAGSIGGSPLAYDNDQDSAELLRHFPGAECPKGDRGAVASLRPITRQNWLATNSLPPQLPYYSLVTLPEPQRVSAILGGAYAKLGKIDARNDSQVIFYDQIIPGSTLVAYINADHWAVAVPIARTHPIIANLFVTQNDYPREALAEALLRFIEEDLDERDSLAAQ